MPRARAETDACLMHTTGGIESNNYNQVRPCLEAHGAWTAPPSAAPPTLGLSSQPWARYSFVPSVFNITPSFLSGGLSGFMAVNSVLEKGTFCSFAATLALLSCQLAVEGRFSDVCCTDRRTRSIRLAPCRPMATLPVRIQEDWTSTASSSRAARLTWGM